MLLDSIQNDHCSRWQKYWQRKFLNMFETFSCTWFHPDPKAWCLDRLEQVPSVIGGVRSASAPSKTSTEEKEFRNISSLGIHVFLYQIEGLYSRKGPESTQESRLGSRYWTAQVNEDKLNKLTVLSWDFADSCKKWNCNCNTLSTSRLGSLSCNILHPSILLSGRRAWSRASRDQSSASVLS